MMRKEETHTFLQSSDNPKGVKVNIVPNMESDLMISSKKLLKKRRQIYSICGTILIIVCLVWLITLTTIREMQIRSLRRDLDAMKIDLAEFKNTIMENGYVEESNYDTETDKEYSSLPTGMPLIDDEDEEDFSDDEQYNEDDYDGPDALSGDGFLGEVMEGKLEDKSQYIDDIVPPPSIRKIMKVLKDKEPEDDTTIRSRRHVIAETRDGVPIIEEPYHVSKARNLSRHNPNAPENLQRNPIDDDNAPRLFEGWNSSGSRRKHKKYEHSTTPMPSLVYTRPSRVMSTPDNGPNQFRVIRMRRPMLRSGMTSEEDDGLSTEVSTRNSGRRRQRIQRYRNMRPPKQTEMIEEDRSNNLLAAHFVGDTRNYRFGHHEHYQGNGRLRHPHEVPYTAWTPSSWTSAANSNSRFILKDGAVTVPENGIYFVYAQIYFHDEHDTNGYQVFKNNGVSDEVILQCMTMTTTTDRREKSNTCYTAAAFYLTVDESISIKNIGSMRYSIMEPAKSFFGFVKLANVQN